MIQKLRQRFQNLKLSKKMFIIFAFILSAAGISSMFAVQVVLNVYDDKLYEKSLQQLSYFIDTVEGKMEGLDSSSYTLCMDYGTQRKLEKMQKNENPQNYLKGMIRFQKQLLNMSVAEKSVINITYIGGKDLKLKRGKEYTQIPGMVQEEFVTKAEEARGGYVYIEPGPEFPYLVSGRQIREHIDYSMRDLGNLMILSDFGQIMEESRVVLEKQQSELCVITEKGIAYSSNQEEFERLGEPEGKQGYQIQNFNGKRYFICYEKSDRTGWTFVNMIHYSDIFQVNQNVRGLTLGGIAIMFLMAAWAIEKCSQLLTHPLNQLASTMEIVQTGDFSAAQRNLGNESAEDEIGMLQQNFKTMLEQIECLIHENYERKMLLKDTQYQALQAQINPHFLYNTLNSISWMIKVGRNEEASDMIMALGRLFREAFSKEPMCTVEEEVSLIEDYISIQKARYGKRLIFVMHCQEEMLQCCIPKMSLQPIVENAILYGVENSPTPCEIIIHISEVRGMVCIEISDTGPGMKKEELEAVRDFSVKPKGTGIGLKNIRERLKLMFGSGFQFEIESEDGKGTLMRLIVPVIRGDSDVQNDHS